MKIIPIGKPRVIMSNPHSKHNYFAWPSMARLQNGKLAVVASGFRIRHVCPFGKTVISYSEDEGESYTAPAPVIDTPLDDRDGGILAFGEQSVIVTSFNNTIEFQRAYAARKECAYSLAYLNTLIKEEEERHLGSTFRLSHDGGVTFGHLQKSPVTSPHGPVELADGSLLWVGRTFSEDDRQMDNDCIQAYRMTAGGEMEYVGRIDNVTENGQALLSCEPHALRLENETILVHIRVQCKGEHPMFSIYQSLSHDNGKTWSKPKPLLGRLGGSPPHLLRHSSGLLIGSYGYREAPYGIKLMFSADEGKTWDTDHDLYVNGVSWDLGYPCTVELKDGSLLTVFYAHPSADEPAVILQQKWRLASDDNT